ncbi:MAG: 8-oxo-dGTP diphosphatase [Candidatus Woesearchaeota archaeon]
MTIKSERTLCILIKDNNVFLSRKLLRHGAGKYNGYGGGIKEGETETYAAIRELKEESGFHAEESDLEKRAVIEFYFPYEPHHNQRVHIYFLYKWQGTFHSDGEMSKPESFPLTNLPYDQMWASDKEWLPYLIDGKKIKAKFVWTQDNQVAKRSIDIVDNFN